MQRLRLRRGFTLMELMITVVILSILTVVAVFSYKRYVRKARTQEAIAMLGDIQVKQAQFFASFGFYQSSTADTAILGGGEYFPPDIPSGGAEPIAWGTAGVPVNCQTVAADTQAGAFCQLGIRPTTPVYFQYKTIGWDPNSPALAGPPPSDMIDLISWQNAGSPRWWYAAARTHWTTDTRPDAWVYVMHSSMLSQPIIKEAYEADFAN